MPYIVQVDANGCQRLCLADGTPIPAQIESTLYQDTEQARQGLCTFSVLVFIEDEIGLNASTTIRIATEGWSLQMPDGRILDVDNYIKRQTRHGVNAVQLTVTAKMIQTVAIGGICNTVNIKADADNA
ncbi:MAG: hypothetical protein IPJ02_17540 [Chitinophagaceae bacterium]|nr:hypothetical protein [Chitinophagaceae bacterium]